MTSGEKRLDRQEMERRVELLGELHEDAVQRQRQYNQNSEINRHLEDAKLSALMALLIAKAELAEYREEWERVR